MFRRKDTQARRPLPPTTTVLCVDDEPDQIAALCWFLRSEHFAVITASSAAEAFASVQEQVPDLIITDHTMPGMSGLELCRRLRAHTDTARIPIILYTALSQPADLALYDRLLIKPTDLEAFAAEIRSLLQASR